MTLVAVFRYVRRIFVLAPVCAYIRAKICIADLFLSLCLFLYPSLVIPPSLTI
jgi:hypothetical protein